MSAQNGRHEQSHPRILRRSLIALGILFVVIIFIEQHAQPGHRAPGQLLQAASLGSRSSVQTIYGLLLAVLAVLVSIAHYGSIGAGIKRLGTLCLLAAAVALFVAGGFAEPMRSPHVSWPDCYWIHLVAGGLVPLLIPASLFAFAWGFYEGPEDDSLQTWTFVAAITTTVIAIALFVFPPQILAGPTSVMTFVARRSHFIVFVVWSIAVIVRRQMDSKEEASETKRLERPIAAQKEVRQGDSEGSVQGSSTATHAKPSTNSTPQLNWEVFAAKVEVLTLPLVLIGGIIALLEYSDAHKRDIREVSQRAYERADIGWTEFLKTCAEHPEANCYDGVEQSGSASQQGAVLSLAVDTFETAFRSYNDAEYANDAPDNYCDEWPTWMVGMRKFARRPAFRETWRQIGNEYGGRFQECMQATIDQQAKFGPTDTQGLSDELPPSCRLDVCAFATPHFEATK